MDAAAAKPPLHPFVFLPDPAGAGLSLGHFLDTQGITSSFQISQMNALGAPDVSRYNTKAFSIVQSAAYSFHPFAKEDT